jgi:hypothetical protein
VTARAWEKDGELVVRTASHTMRVSVRSMSLSTLLGKLGEWLRQLAVPVDEAPELVARLMKLHLDYHRRIKRGTAKPTEWDEDDLTPVLTKPGRRPSV